MGKIRSLQKLDPSRVLLSYEIYQHPTAELSFINGYDLQTLPRDPIRSHLVAISLEPFFLSEPFRNNADPSGKSSDQAVTEAFERMQVWGVIEKRGGLDAH
ncbi:hypothetical protein FQN49_003646 [Arthroderma sp. PD_2]|nr:hypothetical protein FQN49_003646 [Arthroderma sp. PD_2]